MVKDQVLRKLNEAVSQNLVDEDVIPLLHSFNYHDPLVTTSSCSGRFQIISMPGPGDKRGSEVLGKWHRKVSVEEVMDAARRWDGRGELHLLVQPLLLHIRCRDLKAAVELRNLGHGNGMKFSTIRSVKLDDEGNVRPWGAMVEIMGTERIEAPIDGIEEDVLEKCVREWVSKGNALLDRTKDRIPKLIDALSEARF